MNDGSKTVIQMMDDHGLTVAALAMLMQLAEALELSQQVIIEGDCRRDTLEWLRRWREKSLDIPK
ncbi:MAG: hypothetical protein U5N55_04805 [Cypionkella sp.]|nr:hypothetical protein [Cypionkella sp.]